MLKSKNGWRGAVIAALMVICLVGAPVAWGAQVQWSDTFNREGPGLGTTEVGGYTWQAYNWNGGSSPIPIIENNMLTMHMTGTEGVQFAWPIGFQTKDFEMTFDVDISGLGPDGSWGGVQYRATNTSGWPAGGGYLLMFRGYPSDGHGDMWIFGGTEAQVGTSAGWHSVKLRVMGSRHQVWWDNVIKLDYTNGGVMTPGEIHFMLANSTGSQTLLVDNVVVSAEIGTVAGTVTDASTGLSLGDVNVTVGGASTTTGSDGKYTINVSPGTYSVAFVKSGYQAYVQSNVVVTQDTTTTVNAALNLAQPITWVPAWSDGFTRADAGSLGQTETGIYAWRQYGDARVLSEKMQLNCSAAVPTVSPAGFNVDNFDITFRMWFTAPADTWWSGFAYREDSYGQLTGTNYLLYVTLNGSLNLFYGGSVFATANVPTGDWAESHLVRLQVNGGVHKVWWDNVSDSDTPVVAAVHTGKLGAGFMDFTAYSGDIRMYAQFDDIVCKVPSGTTGTVSGVITNAATGLPIEGAKVTTQSGGAMTYTAADGSYSLSIPGGTVNVQISKTGYYDRVRQGIVVVVGSNTPLKSTLLARPTSTKVPAWSDTFTRGDSTVLGDTETGGYTWNSTLSEILGGWLHMANAADPAYAWPVGYTAADFDITFTLWIDTLTSISWSALAYRESVPHEVVGGNYMLYVTQGGSMNLYRGGVLGSATVNTDNWNSPHTVRLRVEGNRHIAWWDAVSDSDTPVLDVTDAGKTGSGYMEFVCWTGATPNAVDFDNIDCYTLQVVDPVATVTGVVTAQSGGAPIAGASVVLRRQNGPVRTTMTNGLGQYSFTDVPAWDVIQVSAGADGYMTSLSVATELVPGQTKTINLALAASERISTAKAKSTGQSTQLGAKLVSGVYSGFFYIQEQDRSCGIKVVSDAAVSVGDIVDVHGTLDMDNGEKVVAATDVLVGASADGTAPLGTINKSLGGLNTGILVKVWGKVLAPGMVSGDFYIDDGSNLPGGLKVDANDLKTVAQDGYVSVTGVLGCEDTGSGVIPVIRPRTADDIAN